MLYFYFFQFYVQFYKSCPIKYPSYVKNNAVLFLTFLTKNIKNIMIENSIFTKYKYIFKIIKFREEWNPKNCLNFDFDSKFSFYFGSGYNIVNIVGNEHRFWILNFQFGFWFWILVFIFYKFDIDFSILEFRTRYYINMLEMCNLRPTRFMSTYIFF